ncbi:MAG: PGPGW domain-containing protein [Smithellaceae bacterium]|nr:PGPGW domain-containing protein [Smithellaceae bacterium]
MRNLMRNILGWLLLILGVAELFLPVLQGILFISLGVMILAPNVPFFHRLLERLKTRYPDAFTQAERLKIRIKSRWFGS